MPSIRLVRHGQASFGGADYDVLSDIGRAQATILARSFVGQGIRPALLVSGSLERQVDTAEPLRRELGGELLVDARWNEYEMDDILAHHSSTEVRTHRAAGEDAPAVSSEDFQELLERALLSWIDAGPSSPARETWPAFTARIVAAVSELAAEVPSGETACVFTSGGVIAALCAAALQLADPGLIAFNRVAVNTGITKLITGRRGLTLVSFNEHSHLEQDGRSLVTYR